MRRIALAAAALAACAIDTVPSALRATPPGTGPAVVFDLMRRPLPEIPLPNDVATFPDPTSRTGRRLDASLVAPTSMERVARAQLDELEGWGTTAPIAVRFEREAGADARAPAIDLGDLGSRMQHGWDTRDDAVYVIDLGTGVPALLATGQGDFPVPIVHVGAYYPNDPHAASSNLVLETTEEGAGLAQADYRPSLDTDFDGVLDHPDTFGAPGSQPGIDDLATWYERETDTLIVRPVLPLEEKTTYAVVLTDRLRGPDGQPVRSPMPQVYHPSQRGGVARLRDVLSDPARAGYYGDIAGTGLDHVAFAWTFTTQPVAEDMRLLRDGLYGRGPFARFASDFPPRVKLYPAAGKALTADGEPGGWQNLPECATPSKAPYVARWASAKGAIKPVLEKLFPLSATQLQGLEDSLDAVDYFVVGTFASPYLIGDPASTNPDDHLHANFVTGDADVHTDAVHFWISVPKARAGAKPPFPVAYWHHGTTLFDTEMFIHAGRYARNGLALASIDAPGHGMVLDAGQLFFVRALLASACLEPFATALASGRAIDLDGDGVPDSGGLIWSAHILRTRDNVRQAVLDAMQFTRILASFDGTALGDEDTNGDGRPDLAGDFDGDGVVDVGGPGNSFFASGGSLGGIVSMIQGALDPHVVASAPVSGAAGLMDVGMRGTVAPVPVLEQAMTPLVVGVPAESRTDDTRCAKGERSVRWVVNDLFQSREIEIACLGASELDSAMTVVVTNRDTVQHRCARTGEGGAFRVALPASVGDRVEIEVFTAPDVVDSYATCVTSAGATERRRIDTWEQAATQYTPVATDGLTCDAPQGCAQFRQTFFPVGSQLVAPQEGLGLLRQTPAFRRLITLSAAALDPADPMNFARFYMRPLPLPDGSAGAPRPLLVATTAGDDQVTTASGLAFARAAGALPFLPPDAATKMPDYADYATPRALWDAWGGRSPDQVLVDGWQMEGVSRLGRTPGAACGVNYVTSKTCNAPPATDAQTCAHTLYDADWLGEGGQNWGQQHPGVPLRLARLAGARVADGASLDEAWSPRVAGSPFAADGSWARAEPLVASVTAFLAPLGQHDWSVGDPCQSFDGTTYMDNLLAHFFATGGRDLYYVSHPSTHRCLATTSCPFFD